MNPFDDRLWERLVDEHGADRVVLAAEAPADRRRPLLIGGGALGVAAAVAAGVVALTAASTAPRAYALTQNPDGSVTVTIHDVETAAPELNARFAAMGIDETVVPVLANCPNRNWAMMAEPNATPNDAITLTPGRAHLLPGYTGVLAAEQLPDGEVAESVGAVKPPVPACYSTTAYTMNPAGTTTGGTPIYDITPVPGS